MLTLSDSERKKKMRLNILRHREKLLKILVNSSETTIKSKILKLYNPNETIDLNEIDKVEEKPPLKVEVKQEVIDLENIKCDNTDEDNVSVGSNSEWNTIRESENETLVGNRRSTRLKSVVKDVHHNTRNEDFVYNLPHAIGVKKKPKKQNCNGPRKKIVVSKRYFVPIGKLHNPEVPNRKVPNRKVPIPKVPIPKVPRCTDDHDRSVHNAKERACRENIAKLFGDLSQMCTYVDTNRRYPSKFSILLASKKECDLLRTFERKLLIEKGEWIKANAKLMKRLKKLQNYDC